MSDPLKQLEATLQAAVQGGVLKLAKGVVRSQALDRLYETYLGNAPLEVQVQTLGIPVGLQFVQLTGTGLSVPFGRTQVDARFFITDEVQLTLTASPVFSGPQPWDLSVSFPPLGSGARPDFVRKLEFGAPSALTLSSSSAGGVPEGLSFSGTLSFVGPVSKLAALFPGQRTLLLAGSIERVVNQNPALRFTAPAALGVQIGPFALRVELRLGNVPPVEGGAASPTLAAAAVLRFGEGPADEFEVAAHFPFDQPTLLITGDSPLELALTAISKLTGANVQEVLPEQLPLFNRFGLKGWALQVNPATLELLTVSVQVGTREGWTLVPKLLELPELDFFFTLSRIAGEPPLALAIESTLVIRNDPPPDGVIDLAAGFPGFAFDGALRRGQPIDLKSLARFISEQAAGDLPELKVTRLRLGAAPQSASYSLEAAISTDWTPITGFTLTEVAFAVSRVAGATSASLSGAFNIGDSANPAVVKVSAAYRSTGGWLFAGSAEKLTISFRAVLQRFFSEWSGFDPGTVVIRRVAVSFGTGGAYTFFIDLLWTIDLAGSPFQVKALADLKSSAPPLFFPAKAGADTALVPAAPVGLISGTLSYHGFELTVGTQLRASGGPVLFFRFLGLVGNLDAGVLTVTFSEPTLGAMIELLVNAATGGQSYRLSTPFDILDSISLSGLELQFDFNAGKRRAGFVKTFTGLDFGFAAIERVGVFYNIDLPPSGNRVEFQFLKGRLLNEKIDAANPRRWDVLNPATAPQTPGLGQGLFDLQFLAIGQRVAPKKALDTKTVRSAVDGLAAAFKKTGGGQGSPIEGTGLRYANEIDWMFGLTANILGNTLALRALFLDPELFGVSIALAGEKARLFQGLRFEVLYKKVNDTVGVYQIELTLPDVMRNLEFGQVSITLPIVRVWIFTNGDFRVDFGFPENEDFTRSFGVQVLPFTGAGGFYFGVLSGASSARVPVTTLGNFSPVIELGLGLRIGIGKEIRKGILSAGLSLTVQGIIEGAFATFNRYPLTRGRELPLLGGERDDAFFYWVKGKFAIVGNLYGSIDFAIISARLDITVTIGVSFELQIFRPATLGFFAKVSVRVEVSINLGIFKITIGMSFSTGISEQFTIGRRQRAPWDAALPGTRRELALETPLGEDPCRELPLLKWQAVLATPLQPVEVIFVPQLSAGSEGGVEPAKARLAALLYVGTTAGQSDVSVPSDFDHVARGTLLWSLNALLNRDKERTTLDDVLDATVSLEQLQSLFCALSVPGQLEPFDAPQVDDFVAHFFRLRISAAKVESGDARSVSLFPMVPLITLVRPDGGRVDFLTHNETDLERLETIKAAFRELEVRYRSGTDGPEPELSLPGETERLSLARFLYVDFFALLARAGVQAAIDTMREGGLTVGPRDSLGALVAAHPEWDLSVEEIGRANHSRALRPGVELRVPEVRARLRRGDTPASLAARFGVAPDALATAPAPGGAVLVRGARHRVGPDSAATLLEVARRFGTSVEELAAENRDVPGLFADGRLLLPAVAATRVRDLVERMQAEARFEHMAGMAARVTLQGLRPPWPDPKEPTRDVPTPLYELTGQQFDASQLVQGSRFELVLPAELEWITFVQEGAESDRLEITLGADEAGIIREFNGATLAPAFTSSALPYYRSEPRRFSLANPIVWRPVAEPRFANGRGDALNPTDPTLWSFPLNLQQLLSGPQPVTPKVEVLEETIAVASLPAPGLPPGEYAWATLFDVTVRRVPSAAAPGTLVPFTYELLGTSAEGGLLLQDLLTYAARHSVPFDQIHLLFPPRPGAAPPPQGLVSNPPDETAFFLLQTNLSTASNPPRAAAASLATGVDPIGQRPLELLKLVWEASVVRSGGYNLFYRHTPPDGSPAGLPDYLFEQAGEVTLTVLVTYAITDDVLRSFLNALAVKKAVDPERTLFYLRALPDSTTLAGAEGPALQELAATQRLTLAELGTQIAHAALAPGCQVEVPGARDVLRVEAPTTLARLAAERGLALAELARANRGRRLRFAAPLTVSGGLVDRIVTVPPGSLGFSAVRALPAAAPDWAPGTEASAATAGLEQLFNLLDYQVQAGGGFRKSPAGLPLTPADQDQPPADPAVVERAPRAAEAARWNYTTAIAVAPFAPLVPPRWPTPPDAVVPDPEKNPYRGIGDTLTVALSWLDLFGNRILLTPGADPTPYQITARLGYYDNLIAVAEWPSLGTHYELTEDARLRVRLAFDGGRYRPVNAQDDWRARVRVDLERYAAVHYQFSRDLEARLGTSLDPQLDADVSATLAGFVIEVYTWLWRAWLAPVAPDPVVLSATLEAPVSDRSGERLFALRVALTLRRTGELVAASADDPLLDPVRVVTSHMRPFVQAAPQDGGALDDEPQPLTLTEFARRLESAFPELKVATGRPESTADDPNPVRAIWLARFSATGFRYRFSDPVYYSVLPLAREPLAASDVPIRVYGSDKPLSEQPLVIESFAGIDLDLLARDFLAALDSFLSPDFAVPAWNLVFGATPIRPNPVADVLTAKRRLAAAIAGRLAPVYADQESRPPNPDAIDELEQQLLVTLSQAYQIDTVVQYRVQVAADGAAEPARLLGQPVVVETPTVTGAGADEAPVYALSTAAFALGAAAQEAFLSFTFTARDKQAASVVSLPLAFRVNNLQHEIRPVAGIDGFRASSWLTFVIPFTNTTSAAVRAAAGNDLGTAEIPVPLRAFPAPPTLAGQTGRPFRERGGDLSTAKLWDYAFTYDFSGAGQDRIHASVLLNLEPALRAAAQDDEPDLVTALLQFTRAYPGLRRDLDENVLRAGDPAKARVALVSLAWLAQRAAAAWGRWAPAGAEDAAAGLARVRDLLTISERAIDLETQKGVLEVSVERDSAADAEFDLPEVRIEGWRTEPAPGPAGAPAVARWIFEREGVYLPAASARAILRRTVAYSRFDVLELENASAGASVGRNEYYGARRGSQRFVYRTPEVRFVSPLTPLLAPEVDIDIASFTLPPPVNDKLATYLRNFFRAFFSTPSGADPGPRTLRLGCAFRHGLGQELREFPIEVPILLTTPGPMSGDDPARVAALAEFILRWFSERGLTGRAGQLRFELSLFASLSATQLPVLRLDRLTLATDKIWETGARADRVREEKVRP